MKTHSVFVAIIMAFSFSFSNDYFEAIGQTEVFSLKAGYKTGQVSSIRFNKYIISKSLPAHLTVMQSKNGLALVKLHVPSISSSNVSFAIYDIRGRIVYNNSRLLVNDQIIEIPLVSGCFILCLRSNGNILTRSIVIH
jgi:hypothetical protein